MFLLCDVVFMFLPKTPSNIVGGKLPSLLNSENMFSIQPNTETLIQSLLRFRISFDWRKTRRRYPCVEQSSYRTLPT